MPAATASTTYGCRLSCSRATALHPSASSCTVPLSSFSSELRRLALRDKSAIERSAPLRPVVSPAKDRLFCVAMVTTSAANQAADDEAGREGDRDHRQRLRARHGADALVDGVELGANGFETLVPPIDGVLC